MPLSHAVHNLMCCFASTVEHVTYGKHKQPRPAQYYKLFWIQIWERVSDLKTDTTVGIEGWFPEVNW